jgi:hypothetical protein
MGVKVTHKFTLPKRAINNIRGITLILRGILGFKYTFVTHRNKMNVEYVRQAKLDEAAKNDGLDVPHSSIPEKKVEEKRTNLLSSISPLAYPPDLTDEFYIEFNAFKANTTRPDETKRTFSFEKSVYLPFPQTVTDTYNSRYSEESLMAGGDFLRNSINEVMTSDGTKSVKNLLPGSGVADRAGKVLASALEKGLKNPMDTAAGAAVYGLQGIGGPIGAAAKAAIPVTTNPYPVLIFQGPGGFKSFGFSWTFFPEDPKESGIIRKIVGYFRREMLPERIDKIPSILKYPAIFEIVINPEIKLFKRCVITSVDVNYTPVGPAFVKEFPKISSDFIEPAAVTLTINFQEVEMWLANDFYSEESKDFNYVDAKKRTYA